MDLNGTTSKILSGLIQGNSLNQIHNQGQSTRLGDAVQKFEAFFIQSMLKSMRGASLASGLFETDKSNFYRDWHDQQLAGDLASKETFAVAKLLRQQFGGEGVKPTPTTSLSSSVVFRRSPYAQINSSIDNKNTTLKQLVTKELSDVVDKRGKNAALSPDQFVQQVYPYAQRAATKLNTSADVLVAVAALETGWGLHTPKSSGNVESFNYFGIKANNWDGLAATSTTKEFDGEKMIEVRDRFRAYESPAESFNDFANLLLENPRYQRVIHVGHDVSEFAQELQRAGYATDPNYAKKITSILNGSILNNAISAYKAGNLTADKEPIVKN